MKTKTARQTIAVLASAVGLCTGSLVAWSQHLLVKGTQIGEGNSYFATVSGAVGVGTTSPASGVKLDVVGAIRSTGSTFYMELNGNPNYGAYYALKDTDTQDHWYIQNRGGLEPADRNFLKFLYTPDNGTAWTTPLKITTAGKLINPRWKATQVWNAQSGSNGMTSPAFTTGGGTLIVHVSGSGYKAGQDPGWLGATIQLDGVTRGYAQAYSNLVGPHRTYAATNLVLTGVAAGSHTITLWAWDGAIDANDYFDVTVEERPF